MLFPCISGTLVNGASDPSRLYCVYLLDLMHKSGPAAYLAVCGRATGTWAESTFSGTGAGGGKSWSRGTGLDLHCDQRKQSRAFPSERVWGACLEEVPLELLKSR